MNINCIIVDDEPIARQGIEKYCVQTGFITVVSRCKDANEAKKVLSENKIDLIFLDIEMPRMLGIDFLKTLTEPPLVIIITAYPNYAIDGYSLDVVDYLLKPVSFERFLKAASKAQETLRLKSENGIANDFIFIKTDYKFEKIILNEILYIEGMQNYIIIHTANDKLITHLTMKMAEEQFSVKGFIRVHKSFIVSIKAIESIESNNLIINKTKIPIGRTFKKELVDKMIARK